MNTAYYTKELVLPCDKPNKKREELLSVIDMDMIPAELKERIIRCAIEESKESRHFLHFEMPHTNLEIDMWANGIALMQAIDEIAVM